MTTQPANSGAGNGLRKTRTASARRTIVTVTILTTSTLVFLLLAWMVVFPAVTMWWQFDEAHRLFADERRDWAGWYWFWPDRLSCWAGWEMLTNPLVGASAWFVLWLIVRRPWRSRTARTGG